MKRLFIALMTFGMMTGSVHAKTFDTKKERYIHIYRDTVTGCQYIKKDFPESSMVRRYTSDGIHLCNDDHLNHEITYFNVYDEDDLSIFTDNQTGCSYISGITMNAPMRPRLNRSGTPLCSNSK